MGRLALLALATLPLWAAAAGVTCHYTYGGQAFALPVAVTDDPYRVPAVHVGSYFLLRAVRLREPPTLHVYTYGDSPDGPGILHQGTWAEAAANVGSQGFTGLQRVYEPVRDSEIEYWCEHDVRRRR